jgi:enoyl-CoA hydratase
MIHVSAAIRLEEIGGVRHLMLDAPERRNALNAPMLREMADTIERVADDDDARVLIVSGKGKAFCAGADVRSLFGDPNRPPAAIRADLRRVYASFLGLVDLEIPTIAAVDGAAVGAGFNIALACDIVVAGPGARFAVTFAEIGLHPGGGCSWFLARRMGYSRAMTAILGAETLDAQQAFDAGLVSECARDATARALELATVYAARPPALVRDMKRALRIAAAGDLATTIEFESWAQASTVSSPRFQEYISTFGK